jgi:hypothetical protein
MASAAFDVRCGSVLKFIDYFRKMWQNVSNINYKNNKELIMPIAVDALDESLDVVPAYHTVEYLSSKQELSSAISALNLAYQDFVVRVSEINSNRGYSLIVEHGMSHFYAQIRSLCEEASSTFAVLKSTLHSVKASNQCLKEIILNSKKRVDLLDIELISIGMDGDYTPTPAFASTSDVILKDHAQGHLTSQKELLCALSKIGEHAVAMESYVSKLAIDETQHRAFTKYLPELYLKIIQLTDSILCLFKRIKECTYKINYNSEALAAIVTALIQQIEGLEDQIELASILQIEPAPLLTPASSATSSPSLKVGSQKPGEGKAVRKRKSSRFTPL